MYRSYQFSGSVWITNVKTYLYGARPMALKRKELYTRLLIPGTQLRLVGRVADDPKSAPNLRKRWRVECSCGEKLTIPEAYLIKDGPRKHCGGDKHKSLKTRYNREYRIWCMMRQRCYTRTHVAYRHYGGRGIKIHPDWLGDKGFENFIKFIGPAPSIRHSIDRVDVDGNYEPYHPVTGKIQVRWATDEEQAGNTRAMKIKRILAEQEPKARPKIEVPKPDAKSS